MEEEEEEEVVKEKAEANVDLLEIDDEEQSNNVKVNDSKNKIVDHKANNNELFDMLFANEENDNQSNTRTEKKADLLDLDFDFL